MSLLWVISLGMGRISVQCLFAAVMIIYEVGSKIRKVEEETTMIPGFSVV